MRRGRDVRARNEPAIRIRGLRKSYRARRAEGGRAEEALKGVDLEVARGSVFGLLGPNGAGKSTLINILAGMSVKSGGTARVWGFDIDVNPRHARASMGVVPQELMVDPFFTPWEAMELQAGFYGVSRKRRRTREILEALDLLGKAHSYSRALSGGMRRRLMVARALAHDPPVLVLDEPTAGVDVELRRRLWGYVEGLKRRGVTVVLTTHYLEEAQELCDEVAIMSHGEVVACDKKESLLLRYGGSVLKVGFIEEVGEGEAKRMSGWAHRVSGGEWEASLGDGAGEMGAREALERFEATGLRVKDFHTRELGLEDVFMRLTSEDE